MPLRTPIQCPECGAQMNRHAEKLAYTDNPADADLIDPLLGGVIEETNTCPTCGYIVVRRV